MNKKLYHNNLDHAGTFENLILYRMCHDFPKQYVEDPSYSCRVFSGKLISIGRIYSASPQRGGGNSKSNDVSRDYFTDVSEWLFNEANFKKIISLDSEIEKLILMPTFIDFVRNDEAKSYSHSIKTNTKNQIEVVFCNFVNLLLEATNATRKNKGKNKDNKFRLHMSFASKYLHFHAPDYFPILDKYSEKAASREANKLKPTAKLKASRKIYINSSSKRYMKFCENISYIIKNQQIDDNFSLRSLDTKLVEIGKSILTKKIISIPKLD